MPGHVSASGFWPSVLKIFSRRLIWPCVSLRCCVKPLLDLAVGALAGHLFQRVEQRVLGAVDVFQLVLEQFLDRLHRHAAPPVTDTGHSLAGLRSVVQDEGRPGDDLAGPPTR